MNEVQTAFVVFFAIFLGTVANVQPRWKAFNWPLVKLIPAKQRRFIYSRLFLSVVLLSIFPVVYFGFALWMLIGSDTKPAAWTWRTVVDVMLHGVLPAFAAFSFYRLWLAAVEYCPAAFYLPDQTYLPEDLQADKPVAIEPTIADLRPVSRAWSANLVAGLAYLLFGVLFLCFEWPQ